MAVTTVAKTWPASAPAEALAKTAPGLLRPDQSMRVELYSLIESLREVSARLEALPVAAEALLSSARAGDGTLDEQNQSTLDTVLEAAHAVRVLSERADAVSRSVETLAKGARPPAKEPGTQAQSAGSARAVARRGPSPAAAEGVAEGTDGEANESPREDHARPIFF